MKKTLAILAAALLAAAGLRGQECSTTWPYLYPEFRAGTIYMNGGTKIVQTLNVHLLRSRMHFIDAGLVKELVTSDVVAVEIGADRFIAVGQDIMQVVASNSEGFVSALRLGEFDKLQETGGAYGSSSTTAATTKLTSVEVSGRVNQSHMELWNNRRSGAEVGIRTTYYITAGGRTYRAKRSEIEETLSPERKAEFKAFLKSTKIKWNSPESLLELTDFLK